MRWPRRAAAAVISAALVAGAGGPLRAAPPPTDEARREAKQLFEQAVKQAESGDSKAALASFRAAYAKAPAYRVLYNIAQLCSRMGDAACAVRAYREYLDEGGAAVTPARRQAVEAELRGLVRTVGTIKVQTSAVDADVTIDDVVVGKTPLPGLIPVNGGTHRVVLVAKDKTVEKGVVVVAGGSTTVVLDTPADEGGGLAGAAPHEEGRPAPVPAPEPARKPASLPPDPARDEAAAPSRATPVVPWLVTGGLAVGTVVAGILTASAYSTYKDKRGEFPITRAEIDSAQGTARDLFILTSVLGAATVISAGVAGWLTVTAGPSQVGASVSGRLP
jgi:hypothetical protein